MTTIAMPQTKGAFLVGAADGGADRAYLPEGRKSGCAGG
jgi:hypothetical protein